MAINPILRASVGRQHDRNSVEHLPDEEDRRDDFQAHADLLAKKNDIKLLIINPPPNESRLNSAAN